MNKLRMFFIFTIISLILLTGQRDSAVAIYNGTLSNGEYPWMVLLKGEHNILPDPYCGGVLIHPEWVLTTHHCWKGINSLGIPQGLYQSNVTVIAYIGGKRFNTGNEVLEVIGSPITYSSSEFYSPDDWPQEDFALWRLSKPSIHKPIAIGNMLEVEQFISNNATFTTMGYGETFSGQGSHSDSLYKFSFNNLETHGSVPNMFFTADVGSNNESTCGGDSGGPLVYSLSGQEFLAGLVHAGNGECGSVELMFFQNVPNYKSWIYRTIDPSSYSDCIDNSSINHSNELLRLFDQTHCTGNIWSTNQVSQQISIGNFAPYSMDIQPGYSVIVYNPQSPPTMSACYSGDLWDMRKDYYPGTSHSIANYIGSIKLISGSCASNTPDAPPSPDTSPLPPGPQEGNGGGVRLFEFPNYEGKLLYTFNVGFSNEPNAEGYSMQVPSGWSVITYRDDNMQGMSECWNADVPNFQDHDDWQTKIQSLQIFNQDMCPTDPPNPTQPPNIQFFSGTGYQGSGPSYNLGFHDHQYFYAGSLSLKTGSSVVLYRIDKRQSVNQAFCFNRSVPNLEQAGWPYQIVGLEVFNFDLCQDPLIETHDYIVYQDEGVQFANCGGHGPTSAADLTNWCGGNWNDQISSLRIKAGWSIKVWEHVNYQGGDQCFSTSMTTFRNDALSNGVSISVGEGDSVISSFAVFDNEYCDGSPDMPASAWGYSSGDGNLAQGQFVMSEEENNSQSITVEWDQSSDSTTQGYHIYEHVDDDFYALVATINSRYTTSWTFNDLPCGTDYHYLVKAFNNWGDSATPNLVAVSTPSCYVEPVWGGAFYLPLIIQLGGTPPQEGPTPNAPSGLHVTTLGQNSITVAWDDNSTIEDNYEVWYQADGGQWFNPTVASNTESYTVSGLECETQYHFVVRAINWDNGNLYYSESNFVSANTDTCGPVEGPTPNAPTDLHKTSSTTTSISVMWNDNSNIEQEYRLGYKATTSADTFFAYLPANTETYTVTGLDCNLQYEIWVTALNTPYYAHSNNIYVYPSSCQ